MKPKTKIYILFQYFYDLDAHAVMGVFDDVDVLCDNLEKCDLFNPDYVLGIQVVSLNTLYSAKPVKPSKKNFIWFDETFWEAKD